MNNEVQLAAFFAYWLSFFFFPSPLDDGLNPFLFPLAVLLAQKSQSRWDRGFWARYSSGSMSVVAISLAWSDVTTSYATWRSTSSSCFSGSGLSCLSSPARVPPVPVRKI